MDILLHNLSHSDMLLGVVVHKAQTLHPNDVHVVRPKFSKFHCISKFLFDHIVQNISSVKIFSSALHNRHSSNETNGSSEEKLHSVPVGFDLRGCPALCDVHDVRFRKDILDSEENSSSSWNAMCTLCISLSWQFCSNAGCNIPLFHSYT